MATKKKIRLRYKGEWTDWKDFDQVQIREDVEAMETHETMTLLEVKKHFPKEYKRLKKEI